MQLQELRSERLRILQWLVAHSGLGKNHTDWQNHCTRLDRIKAKLYELTGHHAFMI